MIPKVPNPNEPKQEWQKKEKKKREEHIRRREEGEWERLRGTAVRP